LLAGLNLGARLLKRRQCLVSVSASTRPCSARF
jgi:hypothetical protein